MSDYMRGYSKRNRRRRASYKKTNSLYENSYYNSRSRWQGRDARTRQKRRSLMIALLGCAVILLFVAMFFIVRSATRNSDTSQRNSTPVTASNATPAAVTAAAVEAEGTSGDGTGVVSKAVNSVDTLRSDAISKPEPKPRSKAIALTFDDGPSTANTMKILSLLDKYNAHATFFVVGNRVASGADLLKKELSIGCEIANHSWDHANLSLMKIKKVNKNVEKTNKLVKKITGYDIKLVRPPYGAISNVMRKKFKYPMVLWSVDTLDWKSRNAKAVMKEVKKQISDGAIILMHDIHESTAEAMKQVLPWLVKNDYDILTVSELMERNGKKMKAGKAYCDAN